MQPKVKRALDRAIEQEGLSPDMGRLLRAIIQTETRGRHTNKDGKVIRGTSGEYGAAQLMPRTAEEVGITDPTDVNQNVLGAARYLKKVHAPFATHPDAYALTLAAYNTGPGNVQRAIRRAGGPDSRFEDIQRHIARSTREKYVPNTLRRFERLGGASRAQDVEVEAPQPAPVDDSLAERDGLAPVAQQIDLQSLADEDPAFQRMLDIYLQTRQAASAGLPQQTELEPEPAPATQTETPVDPLIEEAISGSQPVGGDPTDAAEVIQEIEDAEQARRDLGTGFWGDTMTQALTLGGMTDPLAAAGAALFTPVDRDRPFSERYKDILKARQAQRQQYTEDNPVASMVAGTVPSLALGGWGTSALMRGTGLGARAAGLGSAAAESAAYGAGTSPGAAEGDIGQVLGDAARSGAIGTGASLVTLGLVDGARIGGRAAVDATGRRISRIRPRPDGPHLTDRLQDQLGRAMNATGQVVEDRSKPLRRGAGWFSRLQPNALPRVPGVPTTGPILGALSAGVPGLFAGVVAEAARPTVGRMIRRAGLNLSRAARKRGGKVRPRPRPTGAAPGAPARSAATEATQPPQLNRGPIVTPPPGQRGPLPPSRRLPTQTVTRGAQPPTPAARVGGDDILSSRAVPQPPPTPATNVGAQDVLAAQSARRAVRQPPPPPAATASGRRGRLFPEPKLPEAALEPPPPLRADPKMTPEERMAILDEEVAEAMLEGRSPRPRGNLDETNPGRGQARQRPQGRRYEEPELPLAVQQAESQRTMSAARARPGLVRGPLDTINEGAEPTIVDAIRPERTVPDAIPPRLQLEEPTLPDFMPPRRQLPAPPDPTSPGMQPPEPPPSRDPSRIFPMGPVARRALPEPRAPLAAPAAQAPQTPQAPASQGYLDYLMGLDDETEAAMRSGTDGLGFEMRLMDQRYRHLMEDTNPGAGGRAAPTPQTPPPPPRARAAKQPPRQKVPKSFRRRSTTTPATPAAPTPPRIAASFLKVVDGDPTQPAKLSHVLRESGMEPDAFKAEMKRLHDANTVELFNTRGRPSTADRQAGIPVQGRMRYNVRWLDTDSLARSGAEDASPSPQVRPRVEGEDTLRDAYLGLSGGQLRNRVRLADLKQQSGLSDQEFKKKMRDLHMQEKVILYPDDERGRLTAADKQAAVSTGGEPNHLVYWLDPGE